MEVSCLAEILWVLDDDNMGESSLVRIERIIIMKLKEKIISSSIVVSLIALPSFTPPKAEASFLAGYVIGSMIKSNIVHNKYYKAMLEQGGYAHIQKGFLDLWQQQYPLDSDEQNKIMVNDIMNQLVNHGEYVLDIHNLPFRWQVTTDKSINAFCGATDAININLGLLNLIDGRRDELAAVFAHEMIHGIKHHVAVNAAQNAKEKVLFTKVANVSSPDYWNLIETMMKYSSAKNISVPLEYEADEYGLYLMASAGFNPGGAPAMMSRLLTIENGSVDSFFNPSDHPDTEKRMIKLAELMSKYGYNHVSVKEENKIYIDDTYLLQAKADDIYSSREMAFLIAGGLAKGFHDNNFATMWNFRKDAKGKFTFLNDSEVYRPLIKAVQEEKGGEILEDLVHKAYNNDSKTGNRDKLIIEDNKRKDEMNKRKEKNLKIDKKNVDRIKFNANYYNSIRQYALSMFEADKLISAQVADDVTRVIKADSLYNTGDFDKCIDECNIAIAINPKNECAYMTRALSYARKDDKIAALEDCKKAISINSNNPLVYQKQGDVLNILNNHNEALLSFRTYIQMEPNGIENVPEEYRAELR